MPAQDMKEEVFDDFGGGLNNQSSADVLPKDESPNMGNVLVDESPGDIITRKGFIAVGSTATLSKVNFFKIYYSTNGSVEFIVSDGTSVLSTKDFNTYTTIRNGLINEYNLQAVQVEGKMWFVNGTTLPFTWDGNTAVTVSSAPIGKYIEYYQNRVWIYNSTMSENALHFTALTSTDGFAISPDSEYAWPPTNVLYIGKGNGQDGTAMWIYKNLLFISDRGKIYSIYGTDEYTYYAKETNAEMGVNSQDSVVLADGYVYFYGEDGIYQFDGDNCVRISDKVKNDIKNVNTTLSMEVTDKWDTQADFSGKGTANEGLTVEGGSLKISVDATTINYISNSSDTFARDYMVFTDTRMYSEWMVYIPTVTLPVNTYYNIGKITSWVKYNSLLPDGRMVIKVKNTRTGEIEIWQLTGSKIDDVFFKQSINSSPDTGGGFTVTGDDINSGRFQVSIATRQFTLGSGEYFYIYFPTVPTYSTFEINPATYGYYTSAITTASTVVAWGRLNASYDSNGAYLQYRYRTGTSVAGLASTAWKTITPGSFISGASSEKWIQWSASMTKTNYYSPSAEIYNTNVKHFEGGYADSRPLGVKWDNRVWMVLSTTTEGNNKLTFVKSKITHPKMAWQPMFGFNIKSIARDRNDVLYGGSSNSGTIYRMDYGTNDNGNSIESFYETPDMNFGSLFFDKTLQKCNIDVGQYSGMTLTVGIKRETDDWVNNSFSVSGSNRAFYPIYTMPTNKYGRYYRFRFKNNELDKVMNINNFQCLYYPRVSQP